MEMETNQRGISRKALLIILAIFVAAALAGLWYWKNRVKSQAIDLKTAARAKVERGDLVVTILQSGELESKDSRAIINDTDLNRKIMYVIEDGAKVKKGDLLLELDSSDMVDELLKTQSALSNAEANLRKAKEDIEISKIKYNSDLKSAQLKLDLAKLDLKKYIEAEFPQQVRVKEIEITLAKEDLQSEMNKLEWTQKLVEKGYANRQDLERDQLAVNRKKLDLSKSQEELRILQEYTRLTDERTKSNAITEAQAALESVIKTNASQMAQAEANLQAAETNLELNKKEEEKKRENISKMKVYSEYEGQVFYARMDFWRNETIEKGASVYGRQKILEFPDLSAWNIKTRVPESIIERVKPGQNAVATVDAIANKILKAKVLRVGAAADRGYFDTSQKVYPVFLDCLTTVAGLKPGMSLMVEIITNELKDVLKLPLQAVTTQEQKSFVYVIKGDKLQRVEVKTGENNEQYIQILDGVKEGDEVLLYAPVRQETRAGLKESPLKKAKENDEVPPKQESPDGQETGSGQSERPGRGPDQGPFGGPPRNGAGPLMPPPPSANGPQPPAFAPPVPPATPPAIPVATPPAAGSGKIPAAPPAAQPAQPQADSQPAPVNQ